MNEVPSIARRSAYHEAGHAVIALDAGIAIRSVDITPQGDSAGRCTSFHAQRWIEAAQFESFNRMAPQDRRRLEGELMVLWAGVLAEEEYLGVPAERWEEGFGIVRGDGATSVSRGSDIDQLIEISMLLFGDEEERTAFLEWLRLRTRNTLRQPAIALGVEAVARELNARGRLSGREVRTVWHGAVESAVIARRSQTVKEDA